MDTEGNFSWNLFFRSEFNTTTSIEYLFKPYLDEHSFHQEGVTLSSSLHDGFKKILTDVCLSVLYGSSEPYRLEEDLPVCTLT